MKISVAIATYNGEKYIGEQLQSILDGSMLPYEVIIIDDCSTDATADIVKAFIKDNALAWNFSVADENSGYIRNFRNCLEKCTGDVIFLCDQDDIWCKDRLEKTIAVFSNNTDCLAVNTSFLKVDGNGEPIAADSPKNTSNNGIIPFYIEDGKLCKIGLDTVLINNISPGCTCAFKRQVVERYLSDTEGILPHDWELNLVAAQQNGLYYLNQPTIKYRIHGNNTIGDNSDRYSLKMRGSDSGRLRQFEAQKAQSDYIFKCFDSVSPKTREFAVSYKRFCDNREKILYGGKIMPCFKNLFLYRKVKASSNVWFRGIIGDLVYVLKKKFSN